MQTQRLAGHRRRKNRAYLGFIAPGFILYTLLVIVPIVCSVYYSVFQWSGFGEMKFIGLENFRYLLFEDRMSGIFSNALVNNLKYLLSVLLIITPLQLLAAYALFLKIRCHRYARFMLFLPYVLSVSIVGFFALLLFDGNIGILNTIIGDLFGKQHVLAWFGDAKIAFKLFVGIVLWECMGAGMLIFYADMQSISESIIEASLVDGCGDWRRFFRIIIPNLRASMVTNITLSVIYAMTMFGLPYVLVGASGGANNSLDFIAMVFYRYAFGGTYYGTTDIGFGSSISVVMLVVILVASLVTKRLLRRVRE